MRAKGVIFYIIMKISHLKMMMGSLKMMMSLLNIIIMTHYL